MQEIAADFLIRPQKPEAQCLTLPCIPASKLRRSSRGSERVTLSGTMG